jgi:uncharacterized membrane protein YdjX (TVP38/TMEM64 family)
VNYAWGLTGIEFFRYVFWTGIGKSPNFVFFVALGAASVEGASSGRIPPTLIWTLAILGMVMAGASVWLRTRMSSASSKAH